MLKLRKIALTGSLACGKSSACHFFKEYGAYVVNADEIVHQILSFDPQIRTQIVDLLGKGVLNEQNQFDQHKIAHHVFGNNTLLEKLEAILHPIVRQKIELEYNQAMKKNNCFFLAEIPLLFETGIDSEYEATIVVDTPEITCIQRFTMNKQHSINDYHKRMKRQMSRKETLSKATYILNNSGTIDNLKANVYTLFQKINLSSIKAP
jgi:dephospho-CoA kinase